MILPTSKQLERLVPHAQWQEPDYKNERWKYDPRVTLGWDTLVLQRTIQPSQILSEGVWVTALEQYPVQSYALNELARLIDILYEIGMVIRIERGCTTTLSLAAICNAYAVTKIVIIVQAGAHVTCIDERTTAQHILCTALEIHVHASAQFHYSDHQTVPHTYGILRSITIIAEDHSTVTVRSWSRGSYYAKTFVTAYLQGSHAHLQMQCGALLMGTHYYSLITEQYHRAPYTVSTCNVRLAHYEDARSMYDGRIIIEQNAPQSEAFQDHKALLLHEHARAYARPTLEAKTNDIQCGHGSAIGMPDQEQLWYVQSRGIDYAHAQKMLVGAFLKDFCI